MSDAVADEIRVLGPWVMLAPLAHGGMGSVFIAASADPRAPRTLHLVKTLKTGLASVSDYRPRFLDESRIAVLLRHKHLCQVEGGGEADGEFFLAMELIEGLTFKRLLALLQRKEKQLSPEQATALVTATLRGLHAAHTATGPDGKALGVVHRDVSPHNVMVDVHGRIKVIDFGLATSVLKETFTESAVVLGKSGYMAPEQARGEDVTPSVDQYAAAIVLYELLTDDRFYGDMQSRQIWSVVGAGNHMPRAWSEVPEVFRPILTRALQARPGARFATCADFADALVAACPEAASSTTLESLGAIVRRLKPDELDLIAQARVALAAWDADPDSASRAYERSGTTERLERAPVDATESVSRSSRSKGTGSATRSGARRNLPAPGPDADPPTAETSATAMDRPSEFGVPRRRRRLPLAAAAGLFVVLGVVGVGVLVGVGVTQSTMTTVAPTPPVPPALTAPIPPVTTTVLSVAPAPAPIVPAAAPAPTAPKGPTPRQKAMARFQKLVDSCDHPCVGVLEPVKQGDLQAFSELLSQCEKSCRP